MVSISAMPGAQQLASQSIHDAILQASRQQETLAIRGESGRALEVLRSGIQASARSTFVCIMVTGVLAVALLLIIRPPFILNFHQDARQPWKGCLSISWFSILTSVLIVQLCALSMPIVLRHAMSVL